MYRHFQSNPPCVVKAMTNSGNASNASLGSSSAGSGFNSRSTAGTPLLSASGLHGRNPTAPFRKNSGQVLIEGIDGIMADCASLKVFIEGIGEGTQLWTDNMFM